MLTERVKAILAQIDELTEEEKAYLRRELDIRAQIETKRKPKRNWSNLASSVPYPALGEDAQEYISRTRREADESRKRQLGRSYED